MRQDKLILTQTAGVTKQLGSVVIFNTVFLLRCLNVSSLFTFAEFQKSRLGEVCRALGMFIFFALMVAPVLDHHFLGGVFSGTRDCRTTCNERSVSTHVHAFPSQSRELLSISLHEVDVSICILKKALKPRNLVSSKRSHCPTCDSTPQAGLITDRVRTLPRK